MCEDVGAGEFVNRVGAADRNRPHARAAGGFDAKGRVFEDDALRGRHAQAPCSLQENSRVRLARKALVPADHRIRAGVHLQAPVG